MAHDLSDYDLFKQKILTRCLNYASTKQLEVLKNSYAYVINSNRRMEYIESLFDLINILEKRNIVSSENRTILFDIYFRLTGSHYIDHDNNRAIHNDIKKEIEPEIAAKNVNIEFQQNYFPPENKTHDVLYQKVYSMIATDIGKKWKDMARSLNVRESEIDEIVVKYPRDLKSQILTVFKVVEEREDKTSLMKMICEALDASRRKDLRQKVEKLAFDLLNI